MLKSTRTILVVDDDPAVAACHADILRRCGYEAISETDPEAVETVLERTPEVSLVLLDLRMPKLTGLDLLPRIKIRRPGVGVIMATVVNDAEHAVRAIKGGAYNYLLKPLQSDRVRQVLESYFTNQPETLATEPEFSNFITGCPQFTEIFRRVRAYAETDVTVLIRGETGTGKELIAERMHALSKRREQRLIQANLAALSASLFESELFGHKKGAFTGASNDHVGYLGENPDGTVFLDEIGELELEQQKKLLRVIQFGRYCRVGESTERPVKSRLILATNRDLEEATRAGRFREDLYYRISSHAIHLPPLRDRPGDIERLTQYFLRKYSSQFGRNVHDLSAEAVRIFSGYPFPGNVRELEGVVSGAVLVEQSSHLQPESLPPYLRDLEKNPKDQATMRYNALMEALATCGGNQTRAAQKLGVSRATLCRWLKEFRERNETRS